MDPSRIAEVALSKKIVDQAAVNAMTDDEKILLIFRPGFSTAETVTDVSGRGMGMDIVKDKIEQLGGTVSIETVIGKGTTFVLRYPVSKKA